MCSECTVPLNEIMGDELSEHRRCDAMLCRSGDIAPGTIKKQNFKMAHSERCFSLFLGFYKGNKCIITKISALKHVCSQK